MASEPEKKESRSEYYNSLDSEAQKRYSEKLIVDGVSLPDPYSVVLTGWESNVKLWPSVEYGSIYNFLINTPGVYTKEKLQAYKSLDGYNFFASGHVQTCFINKVEDRSVCIMKAKVKPSQRMNDKPHEPWVVLDKKLGYVVASHCTCKAGLGEACSHVAALLFKVEAAARLGLNEESKTSVACVWNQYYKKKVQQQPVEEIDFTKPVRHRQKKKEKRRTPVSDDDDDLDPAEALRSLKRVCPTACVFTKDGSDTDSASDDEDLPPLLTRFHEVEFQDLTKEELDEKCQRFVRDFSTTEAQARNLESMTRGQHNSPYGSDSGRGV